MASPFLMFQPILFYILLAEHSICCGQQLISSDDYSLRQQSAAIQSSQNQSTIKIKYCYLDGLKQATQIACKFVEPPKSSRTESLGFTCGKFLDIDQLKACSFEFDSIPYFVCHLNLRFILKPREMFMVPKDWRGCDGKKIQLRVNLLGKGFQMDENDRLDNKTYFLNSTSEEAEHIELIETKFTNTNMTKLADIRSLMGMEFNHSKALTLENNYNLEEAEMIDEEFFKISKFPRLSSINITNSRMGLLKAAAFILTNQHREFIIQDTFLLNSINRLPLGNPDTGPSGAAVQIHRPQCRDHDLKVVLKNCSLTAERLPVTIFNNGSQTKDCSATETNATITIDLRANEYSGVMRKKLFARLLSDANIGFNKAFKLYMDPIHCCAPINWWLFVRSVSDARKNYREFIWTECLEGWVDFKTPFPIDDVCLNISTTASPLTPSSDTKWILPKWAVYALILGTMMILFLIAVLVCCLMPGANSSLKRHSHQQQPKGRSASLTIQPHRSKSNDLSSRSRTLNSPRSPLASQTKPRHSSKLSQTGSSKASHSDHQRKTATKQRRRRTKTRLPESETAFLQPDASMAVVPGSTAQPPPPAPSRASSGAVLIHHDSATAKSPTSPKFERLVSPGGGAHRNTAKSPKKRSA